MYVSNLNGFLSFAYCADPCQTLDLRPWLLSHLKTKLLPVFKCFKSQKPRLVNDQGMQTTVHISPSQLPFPDGEHHQSIWACPTLPGPTPVACLGDVVKVVGRSLCKSNSDSDSCNVGRSKWLAPSAEDEAEPGERIKWENRFAHATWVDRRHKQHCLAVSTGKWLVWVALQIKHGSSPSLSWWWLLRLDCSTSLHICRKRTKWPGIWDCCWFFFQFALMCLAPVSRHRMRTSISVSFKGTRLLPTHTMGLIRSISSSSATRPLSPSTAHCKYSTDLNWWSSLWKETNDTPTPNSLAALCSSAEISSFTPSEQAGAHSSNGCGLPAWLSSPHSLRNSWERLLALLAVVPLRSPGPKQP